MTAASVWVPYSWTIGSDDAGLVILRQGGLVGATVAARPGRMVWRPALRVVDQSLDADELTEIVALLNGRLT